MYEHGVHGFSIRRELKDIAADGLHENDWPRSRDVLLRRLDTATDNTSCSHTALNTFSLTGRMKLLYILYEAQEYREFTITAKTIYVVQILLIHRR